MKRLILITLIFWPCLSQLSCQSQGALSKSDCIAVTEKIKWLNNRSLANQLQLLFGITTFQGAYPDLVLAQARDILVSDPNFGTPKDKVAKLADVGIVNTFKEFVGNTATFSVLIASEPSNKEGSTELLAKRITEMSDQEKVSIIRDYINSQVDKSEAGGYLNGFPKLGENAPLQSALKSYEEFVPVQIRQYLLNSKKSGWNKEKIDTTPLSEIAKMLGCNIPEENRKE